MSNKNVTGQSRRLAFRAPLDVADEAIARAAANGYTVTQAIVAALRRDWRLDTATAPKPESDPS